MLLALKASVSMWCSAAASSGLLESNSSGQWVRQDFGSGSISLNMPCLVCFAFMQGPHAHAALKAKGSSCLLLPVACSVISLHTFKDVQDSDCSNARDKSS